MLLAGIEAEAYVEGMFGVTICIYFALLMIYEKSLNQRNICRMESGMRLLRWAIATARMNNRWSE